MLVGTVEAVATICRGWPNPDDGGAPAGVGKLVSATDQTATIEYFHSPTDDPVLKNLPTQLLQQIEIPAQTRLYWLDPAVSVWRVGRVIDGEGDRFLVRFPNGNDRLLSTQDLYVRWDQPINDPTPYLAHWVNETPLFADARSGFLSALVEQRAACQGMSALISSVIDLEPHQVQVVQRILQDPIQRYLLADEVGLGKTIEAGVLIRQYAIDDPDHHRVVVLVPEQLVGQWRDELRRRFLLDVGGAGKAVCVLSSDDPIAVASALEGAGMLVIDEAHHLSRKRVLFELLCDFAAAIPRVLLLSATPVLRNERGFLEMLHLLDPLTYPLDGEEAFRSKIAGRQALAEIAAGLIPENLLQIEDFLDDLVNTFGEDPLLISYVSALRNVVATIPSEDDLQFVQALSQIRAHLSEVYRLDRRVLRNRRGSVVGLTPDRAGATFVVFRSPVVTQMVEAVEAWRSEAALSVYNNETSETAQEIAAWFADLLDAMLSSDYYSLQKRLEAPGPRGAPDVDILRAAAENMANDEARMIALLEALAATDEGVKSVVFFSSAETADRVADFLRARLREPVERPSRQPHEAGDGSIRRFMEELGCRILVCDWRDEEGLNLQGGAKAIVHYDLPLNPNRIEQRMGRLDRYGAGHSIKSFVLRSLDDPMECAWTICLSDAFGVSGFVR